MTDHQAKLFSLPRLKKIPQVNFAEEILARSLGTEAARLFAESFLQTMREHQNRLFGALGVPQEYFIMDDEARHKLRQEAKNLNLRLMYGAVVRPPSFPLLVTPS